MTTPNGALTMADIAAACRAAGRRMRAESVSRYLNRSKRKTDRGEPLGPRDLPLPTWVVSGRPLWADEPGIRAWIRRNQNQEEETA